MIKQEEEKPNLEANQEQKSWYEDALKRARQIAQNNKSAQGMMIAFSTNYNFIAKVDVSGTSSQVSSSSEYGGPPPAASSSSEGVEGIREVAQAVAVF